MYTREEEELFSKMFDSITWIENPW